MAPRRVLHGIVLVGVSLALSCGGTSGGQPPWRGGRPGARTQAGPAHEFAPSGAPAGRYGDGATDGVPSSALHDAGARAVRDAAASLGIAAPAPDARLYAVAADLAAYTGDGELPPYDVIEFSLAHHGLVEPSPEIVLVTGDERAPDAVAAALEPKVAEALARSSFSRLGVGVAPRGGSAALVVIALQETHVELEPVARRGELGASLAVRGRVLSPFGDPSVFVTGDAGAVDKLPLVRDGGAGFRGEVKCRDHAGKLQVEVTGRGPQGVTVLANFPIWCGEDPPTRLSVASGGDDEDYTDAADAEQRIFTRLNADRAGAGLPPLVWDEQAAKIARAHSQDMATNHFVAHISPTTGSAYDRAKAAGLVAPLILENVARAYSPGEAQRGFMNSPGHRANVLSPDATHVGIGVVLGDEVGGKRELYVTQLFYRVPPRISRSEARASVRAEIDRLRQAAGLRALSSDRDLDALAQVMADELAAGRDRDDVQRRGEEKMERFATRFSSVITVAMVIGDAKQVGADSVGDASVTYYGLGVTQGNHPDVGKGALYVVILLAKTR